MATSQLLWTPANPERLNPAVESDQELDFLGFLDDNFFGQPEAREMLRSAYLASQSLILLPDQPLFSAMSLGKSRTGKSEGPRLLAQFLHGSRRALVRINLNKYKQEHQVATLIGAPHGYLGFDKQPVLGRKRLEASRPSKSRCPYIILVLEEIEKAHDDVADVLMDIFDNGEAELANGEVVNFRDVLIFATSNLAARQIAQLGKGSSLGFNAGQRRAVTPEQIKETVRKAIVRKYKPEFLNRLGELVIYRDLGVEDVRRIVHREVADFQRAVTGSLKADAQFVINVQDSAQEWLLKEAVAAAELIDETDEGAGSPVAELKRLIARHITRPVNRELLKKTIKGGDYVDVSYEMGTCLSLFSTKGGALIGPEPEAAATTEAVEEPKTVKITVQESEPGTSIPVHVVRGGRTRKQAVGLGNAILAVMENNGPTPPLKFAVKFTAGPVGEIGSMREFVFKLLTMNPEITILGERGIYEGENEDEVVAPSYRFDVRTSLEHMLALKGVLVQREVSNVNIELLTTAF